jgi:hypothetical protein
VSIVYVEKEDKRRIILVRRSSRDESTWIVTHLCMEAILGIPLYSYPYLNYQKCFVFLIIAYVFSSTKLELREEQVLPGSEGGRGEREGVGGGINGPNNVYTCE